MRKLPGYTLLELLIALSITSILSTIGLPAFSNLIAANRSIVCRDMLLGAINFARFEAISRTSTITLCPKLKSNLCGKSWSTGILIFIDKDQNGKISQEDEVIREIQVLTTEESLTWNSFGSNNYLRYTSLGNTLNQNGTFIYCPSSKEARHAQAIIINRSGRARASLDNNSNGIVERANGKDVSC
jgi:type IV fimbrial biogenesis protein FimT